MLYFKRMFLKVVNMSNWLLFWSTTSLIFFSTYFIAYLEPETFPTLFDALWWVMTTVTTVGYGDFYPVSVAGRVYAIFLYVVGIGAIGVVIGKVVDAFGIWRKKREEGKLDYNGTGHIVLIGWSKKASYAVKEIMESEEDIDVVIIDTLEKSPLLTEKIHYIQGEGSDENILMQANLKEARAVLVFADDNIQNSALADGKTLLIAAAIERLSSDVHVTVEVLKEEHIKSFEHANVEEFVLTHETISHLAVRSALSNGISSIYSQLMSRGIGDDLYEVAVRSSWRTYRDAFNALLSEGATLISDGSQLNINRKLDEPISDDARLYVICNRETYQRISEKIT
ncbi:potassium channel family protein [Bacillus taeanensis]|uniref:Ion transporter n=1 Tax=Bacillus taeanensis TaxID=273032 RepID=A0A366Y4V2_9BACI|nr:potassium channel protein [Bacillus taeanensis]RBW71414.1 ion transporter [Bacillus taeanensis]